jgi:hypothetical protein
MNQPEVGNDSFMRNTVDKNRNTALKYNDPDYSGISRDITISFNTSTYYHKLSLRPDQHDSRLDHYGYKNK